MQVLNPAWKRYNDINNEGGDGYNPHPKFIASVSASAATHQVASGSARMVGGKLRTHDAAVKFARVLSGTQRQEFLAQIKAAFPEHY